MSEVLGELDMGPQHSLESSEEASEEGSPPLEPQDRPSEPLIPEIDTSAGILAEQEAESLVTSPPNPQQELLRPWRPHKGLPNFNDLKQKASEVVGRITGTSSSSFRMLSATDAPSGKWIKELSSMANVVVGRCARMLLVRPEDLQESFEEEAPAGAKESAKYARNLLEYCCFRALAVATQVTDHLRDKDFRRWTFDMMLAWDAPAATSQPSAQVDSESRASLEAFARLAPAVPLAADSVTVHALFELLTEDSSGRMAFAVYNRYLTELEKTVRTIRTLTTSSVATALGIVRGEESVVEIDGGTPTQPVLQHIGVTAWPGRVTLTDQAFYIEASGVVSYDSAKKYDLSSDLRQIIKPDLVGPWGAKLFDKAITYQANPMKEPVVLEFSELTGHMRRDYWLAILREIVVVHTFVRNNRLEGPAKRQAVARAVRGIARLKTLWTLNKSLPPTPELHLTFLCADELPGGDAILKAMALSLRQGDVGAATPAKVSHLDLVASLTGPRPAAGDGSHGGGSPSSGTHSSSGMSTSGAGTAGSSPVAVPALSGPHPHTLSKAQTKGASAAAAAAVAALLPSTVVASAVHKEQTMPVGDLLVGDMTALERAVQSSRESSKKVAKAKKTLDEAKLEGMGPNLALFQELILPAVVMSQWLNSLAHWESPIRTVAFLACALYTLYRDWLCYAIPFLLLCNATLMVSFRFAQQTNRQSPGTGSRRNEIVVVSPPNKNAVEQILVVQAAIAQLEKMLQSVNITLLKMRALTLSELPQATDELIAANIIIGILLAVLPLRLVVLLILLEVFTRNLEFRKEQTERISRRLREWWHRIPVVPVRFVDENKDII